MSIELKNRDMIHAKRKINLKLQIPKNSILGLSVFSGIALAVIIVILNKEESRTTASIDHSTKIVKVVDGDTIEIGANKFRLFGIDAPERNQPCKKNNVLYDCGGASKKHLEFIISGANVECDKKNKDKWGRYISVCTADGEDISELMVKHGWALAYRKYSSVYVSDEEFAKSNKLGMWAKDFSIPSEWRKFNKGNKL